MNTRRLLVLLGLTCAVGLVLTACGTPAPPVDESMDGLSDEARQALGPDADLLAPARHVMEAYRSGAHIVFADARTQLDYDYGHIPGAINVPYFDPVPYLGQLPKDKLIVSYCECPHAEAVQLAETLLENGFTRVKVIDEGLAGWLDQGGELEKSPAAEQS